MTHLRHFGLPGVTTRSTSGGIGQSSGPHNSAVQTRADPSNIISLVDRVNSLRRQPNSLGSGREFFLQNDQPVIEPYELGSGLLFLFVMLAPAAIVGGLVIGYLLFVS